MSDYPSLTWAERLVLWNQLELLKHLSPAERDDCERNQRILEDGYRIFYSDMNASIARAELPVEIGREVIEILNMYRVLTFEQKKTGHHAQDMWATFQGFDGNASEGHYGFADFLRRTEKRWQELADAPANSHSEVLPKYRRMLEAWKRVGSALELTPDEIDEIVGA